MACTTGVPAFRNLCSNEVHTGLYLVRAKALKERMVAAADNTARKLLDQIQTMSRDSNEHVCHTYATMATGVTTVRALLASLLRNDAKAADKLVACPMTQECGCMHVLL